jgi:hypothetical protein
MRISTIDKYHRITREIDELDYTTQLNLLSYVIASLKKDVSSKSSTNLTELKGLGKELWTNVDVENYITNERKSWN